MSEGTIGDRIETAARGSSREGMSRQDCWADDWAWTVSWMSMNRIDQYPGRGSGSSCRELVAVRRFCGPRPRADDVE